MKLTCRHTTSGIDSGIFFRGEGFIKKRKNNKCLFENF